MGKVPPQNSNESSIKLLAFPRSNSVSENSSSLGGTGRLSLSARDFRSHMGKCQPLANFRFKFTSKFLLELIMFMQILKLLKQDIQHFIV